MAGSWGEGTDRLCRGALEVRVPVICLPQKEVEDEKVDLNAAPAAPAPDVDASTKEHVLRGQPAP